LLLLLLLRTRFFMCSSSNKGIFSRDFERSAATINTHHAATKSIGTAKAQRVHFQDSTE